MRLAPFAPPRTPRARRRAPWVAVTGGTLALALTAGCGAAEQLTAGMRAKSAVDRLGERPSASVIASVDGTEADVRRFLRTAHGSEPSPRTVHLVASAEVTLAVGSGSATPLREMRRSDAMNMAAAVNLGEEDLVAVKSVRDKLFLRARPVQLADEGGFSEQNRRKAREAVALADALPHSLRSARDALEGRWIELDPEAFDDFGRSAAALADRGDRAGRDPASGAVDESANGRRLKEAVEIASTLDGQSQREFVQRVETLLRRHARFRDAGKADGAGHIRVTLPGRKAARDLTAALRPLRIDIRPSRVPDRDISADLEIRRGQLTGMTVDLGQFTGEWKSGNGVRQQDAHLPLRLRFGGGDAVPVDPPDNAAELRPADLMAALVYGALGGAADF